LSESWSFTSAETVTQGINKESELASTLSSTTASNPAAKDEMDKELLKTLSSFLQSQGQTSSIMSEKERSTQGQSSATSTWDDKTVYSGFFPSACPVRKYTHISAVSASPQSKRKACFLPFSPESCVSQDQTTHVWYYYPLTL
jgi:hypothetical protein